MANKDGKYIKKNLKRRKQLLLDNKEKWCKKKERKQNRTKRRKSMNRQKKFKQKCINRLGGYE